MNTTVGKIVGKMTRGEWGLVHEFVPADEERLVNYGRLVVVVGLNVALGEEGKYLKEGLEVIIGVYEERPVSIQLPKKIKYKVVEAPPAVKGDSASGNVTKEIVLDNGLKIQAPIFIKEGEEILVNTETGDYSARA
jgi:hypothetical protein